MLVHFLISRQSAADTTGDLQDNFLQVVHCTPPVHCTQRSNRFNY